MEAELDKWHDTPTEPGRLRRVQDGEIWKTIKGVDRTLFFDNAHTVELRIGVTMGFDGFAFACSAYARKHSTGNLSLCVQNLEVSLRYPPENLLLCGLTPGPREFSADELQHFMAAFITDLLKLYDERIVVKTAGCPIVAVCCDHPAMCRLCGFSDSGSQNIFCTWCRITKDQLKMEKGLTIDAFPLCDGDDHRKLAEEYSKLHTQEERDAFCQANGVRGSELNRLPYWNPVRMAIIDPMHNLLLGIMKNIWFDVWVKDKALRERTQLKSVPRKLDRIHGYLTKFEMPSWVARLPKDVGYPAGGSLTSDKWKALLLVYGPIMIPFIWDEWSAVADTEYGRKLASWTKNDKAHRKCNEKRARGEQGGDLEFEAPKPKRRMHSKDANNFLSLAATMKILLA
ncbi:uncharacterized protein PHACADRAFT_82310 [Phanerochaete carnosa HHB-10118-sp]|uniref:Uncharacterized protein n=1 Tax=Phanerochaete carnosa (strain HHB-10118-sp) TaxID=650164 RepID=K5WR20_PHACS|nr:uncharacterized protein PHACADRAFT_82310 [Phanerochaete carnosa HHB-10118-sp]EKM61709.1 hypothetical protein PHACADRAFT_82310 [Phanerochaete carnosa HHB-10118-sp]